MKHVPLKRCDRKDVHDEHLWKQGVFSRRCPGRTTPGKVSRSRRAGHPRSPKES